MAADRAAVASGADVADGLRKRPVNNGTPTPPTSQPEDNKKKAAKKVRLELQNSNCSSSAHGKNRNSDNHNAGRKELCRHLRTMGAHLCPAHLHCPGLLHSTMEDWLE